MKTDYPESVGRKLKVMDIYQHYLTHMAQKQRSSGKTKVPIKIHFPNEHSKSQLSVSDEDSVTNGYRREQPSAYNATTPDRTQDFNIEVSIVDHSNAIPVRASHNSRPKLVDPSPREPEFARIGSQPGFK